MASPKRADDFNICELLYKILGMLTKINVQLGILIQSGTLSNTDKKIPR